jgi:hypothetical protein
MIRTFRGLAWSESGVAAIEFAICSTFFLAMLIGGIYASMLGFTSGSLHESVEYGARCRAMAITCTDSTSTVNFATSKFTNLTGTTPSFTSDTAACGNRVTGSLSYRMDWIISSSTVPLSATACFPTQAASTS